MARGVMLIFAFSAAILDLINGQSVEQTTPGEYMVCKPIAGVFGVIAGGKNSTEKGIMPVLQGPEGAPGPPGKTGLPGPRGEPNYQRVTEIVRDKLNPLEARIFTLESEIKKLKVSGGGGAPSGGQAHLSPTQSPEQIKNAQDCLKIFRSPVNIDTMCYNIIGGDGLLWTYEAAESNCTKRGGHLADLNSKEIYDKMYNYIDSTYSTVVQAWTGMKYEDNTLLLRSGVEASYAKWSSGYPRKSTTSYYASYKHVYVYFDTSAYIRRLTNTRSSTKRAYAICSYDLNANSTTAIPDVTKADNPATVGAP